MSWDVQLFELNYDSQEVNAVNSVLSSGWLTMGERTALFEQQFSEFVGCQVNSLAVSSCTAALHMALLALGVSQHDEVIISGLTFVANANVVKMVGAKPVFADISAESDLNVSLESIAKKITPKTKAVILVHFAGYPVADTREICELCSSYGIRVVEDVAHAPGAQIDGVSVGTFGDIACYSFFSNKNLSVGEGGMVVTSNTELLDKLRSLRSHGMSTLTLDRHRGRAATYDVNTPGLNYRMDEIRAALGIVQLRKLKEANSLRAEHTRQYFQNLKDTSISLPFLGVQKNIKSAYHIMPIILPEGVSRLRIMSYLKQHGIQSSIHYPAFWDFEYYKKSVKITDLPILKNISERLLTLPLYPTMKINQINKVCVNLLEAINK